MSRFQRIARTKRPSRTNRVRRQRRRTRTQNRRTKPQPQKKKTTTGSQVAGPTMFKVTSSNVKSIGYDSVLQVLSVNFLNGGEYEYYDVPRSIYNQVRNAGSKGKALWHLVIRGWRSGNEPYPYKKIN